MKIKSLGRQTDLIFSEFSGTIDTRDNYTLIKTPSNPGYHWGNYIIFDHAPKVGDLDKWKALFDKEFNWYSNPHHYVFTWDTERDDKGDIQEFLDAGFEFDSAVVLTTETIKAPPHINQDIEVRKIESDDEWESVVHLQTLCSDPKYLNEYYEPFKREQISQYRKMTEANRGNWFGAFLDKELVGDLGIFYKGGIARYQNVGTHPKYRRQGICGTLVAEAGRRALQEYGVQYLVMEADPEYHAARIYESVGFKRKEVNYSLSWWKG